MERITSGLLSLTLIVPYIFCFYYLIITMWGTLLLTSNVFDFIFTILIALFLIFVMGVSGYILISDAYTSIKK
jgi:hypothetical protein